MVKEPRETLPFLYLLLGDRAVLDTGMIQAALSFIFAPVAQRLGPATYNRQILVRVQTGAPHIELW